METAWDALAAKAQSGDSEAYGALLSSLLPALRSFVAHRVRQPDWREDVVQEILLSVHKALPTYRASSPFAPWLYSIARYRLVDFYRRRGRTLAREELRGDFAANFSPIVDSVDQEEASFGDALGLALADLPERQRRAVLLLKQDDLSVREAAAQMGVTESSLKVLAHRGYKALKSILRNR